MLKQLSHHLPKESGAKGAQKELELPQDTDGLEGSPPPPQPTPIRMSPEATGLSFPSRARCPPCLPTPRAGRRLRRPRCAEQEEARPAFHVAAAPSCPGRPAAAAKQLRAGVGPETPPRHRGGKRAGRGQSWTPRLRGKGRPGAERRAAPRPLLRAWPACWPSCGALRSHPVRPVLSSLPTSDTATFFRSRAGHGAQPSPTPALYLVFSLGEEGKGEIRTPGLLREDEVGVILREPGGGGHDSWTSGPFRV